MRDWVSPPEEANDAHATSQLRKALKYGALIIVLILAASFLADWTMSKNSTYNQGLIQDLRAQEAKYKNTAPEHNDAMGAMILQVYGAHDPNKMPMDLQLFLQQIRNDRGRAK